MVASLLPTLLGLGARGIGALARGGRAINRSRFGFGTRQKIPRIQQDLFDKSMIEGPRTPGAVRRGAGLEGLLIPFDIQAARDEDATPLETAGYGGLATLIAPSVLQRLFTGKDVPASRFGRNVGRAGKLGMVGSLAALPLEFLFGGEPNQELLSSENRNAIIEQKAKDVQDEQSAQEDKKVDQNDVTNEEISKIFSDKISQQEKEALIEYDKSEKTKDDLDKLNKKITDIRNKSNEPVKKAEEENVDEAVASKETLDKETKPKIDMQADSEGSLNSMKQEATKNRVSGNNPSGSIEGAMQDLPDIGVDFGALETFSEQKEQLYKSYQSNIDEYEKKIQDDFDQKQTFDEYKARYADALGDNDFEKNMTLIKFGLNMIGGRSFDRGLQGALDITTKAGNVFVDDLMAIRASEKKQNLALLNGFMAYEKVMEANLSQGEKDVFNKNQALLSSQIGDIAQDRNKLLSHLLARDLAREKNEQLAKKARDNSMQIQGKTELALIRTPGMNMFGLTKFEFATTKDGQIGVVDKSSYKDGRFEIKPLDQVMVTKIVDGEKKDVSLLELYNERQKITANPKARNQALVGMNMAKTAAGFINDVLAINKQGAIKFGTVGSFQSKFASYAEQFKDLAGIFPGVKSNMDEVLGDMTGQTAQQYQKILQSGFDVQYKNYLLAQTEGKDWKEKDKFLAHFDKEMREVENEVAKILVTDKKTGAVSFEARKASRRMGIDIDKFQGSKRDQILSQVALLRLIEQRMKYMLANANKPTDRLTVADVTDAAGQTSIITFGKSDKEIALAYKNLMPQFQQAFRTNAELYMQNGGDPSIESEYKMMDLFQEFQILTDKQKKKIPPEELSEDRIKEVFPQGLPTVN